MPAIDQPIQASDEDIALLRKINEILTERARTQPAGSPVEPGSVSIMVGDDSGTSSQVPEPLFDVIREAIDILLEGGAVAVMPYHAELTTQEAADYLGVSRPYLISLLEEGLIPYRKLRSHRRIVVRDLELYRLKRDAERKRALDDLSREMYAAGLYGVMSEPEPDAQV